MGTTVGDSPLARFGSAEGIVDASRRELLAADLPAATADAILAPDSLQLERCQRWLEGGQHHTVTWQDPKYPTLLKEIPDPPALLFVWGEPDALSLPQLAIVGSRNATPGGLENAHRFAAHLAAHGFCITSGLAVGVDAAAHRGAMDAGGVTVAVCGTGPDQVYPARHASLAAAIAKCGALVTELPPGTGPRRQQFPSRNRILSGLAVGTLVVEAGQRSGALITARLAGEQGREVFAIPGSIHNPMAKGCHRLIRSGAKLVETATDIVEELTGIISSLVSTDQTGAPLGESRQDANITEEQRNLLNIMGWDPVSVTTVVSRSGLTTEEVSSMLLILELQGFVVPLKGGRYQQREERRAK